MQTDSVLEVGRVLALEVETYRVVEVVTLSAITVVDGENGIEVGRTSMDGTEVDETSVGETEVVVTSEMETEVVVTSGMGIEVVRTSMIGALV